WMVIGSVSRVTVFRGNQHHAARGSQASAAKQNPAQLSPGGVRLSLAAFVKRPQAELKSALERLVAPRRPRVKRPAVVGAIDPSNAGHAAPAGAGPPAMASCRRRIRLSAAPTAG